MLKFILGMLFGFVVPYFVHYDELAFYALLCVLVAFIYGIIRREIRQRGYAREESLSVGRGRSHLPAKTC